MSDRSLWLHVPEDPRQEPFEVSSAEVRDAFHMHQHRTFLVSAYIWNDYCERKKGLESVRAELTTYGTPELVAVARRPHR